MRFLLPVAVAARRLRLRSARPSRQRRRRRWRQRLLRVISSFGRCTSRSHRARPYRPGAQRRSRSACYPQLSTGRAQSRCALSNLSRDLWRANPGLRPCCRLRTVPSTACIAPTSRIRNLATHSQRARTNYICFRQRTSTRKCVRLQPALRITFAYRVVEVIPLSPKLCIGGTRRAMMIYR